MVTDLMRQRNKAMREAKAIYEKAFVLYAVIMIAFTIVWGGMVIHDNTTPSHPISGPEGKVLENIGPALISETYVVPLNDSIDPAHVRSDASVEIGVLDKIIYRMEIDDTTLAVLTRVVEAEVTGETASYKGKEVSYEELLISKIRVAQVFMNRVEDQNSFKTTTDLYTALTAKNASSTFGDGRYYTVEITDITREAVRLALLADTPDYTAGALYFSSGTTSNKYGELLFVDAVGHAFFK